MGRLLHQVFVEKAQEYAAKTALQVKRSGVWSRWSYTELEAFTRGIAASLVRRGYGTGERAVILLENSPEWVALYFGLLRAGLVCVPVDSQLAASEVKRIVEDCQACIIFASAALRDKKLPAALPAHVKEVITVDDESFGALARAQPSGYCDRVRDPSDTAALIYTSGTTGLPKAVMLSHANIYANFLSCQAIGLARQTDNFIALLPLHHTYPFMVTVIIPLLTGATVTFAPAGFKPDELSAFMREAQVTILTGVPQLFSLLYRAVSSRLAVIPSSIRPLLGPVLRAKIRKEFGAQFRLAISGGARLDPAVGRGLKRLSFCVIEGYGLTEASPVVSFNPPRHPRYGSAGRALPGVAVRIDAPDERGEGEILIKGDNVMKGYYNHEEWTREVLRDGWLSTGDRGYLDRRGFIFITGRQKEVIVLPSGKNIYPQELEQYYVQSPYIKEICILEKSQESFGSTVQSLFAVIVPDFEYFKSQKEARVHAKIRWELENLGKGVPAYQHIMGFVLSKEPLPRTTLNKLQRYKVRQIHLEGRIPPLAAAQQAYSQEDAQFMEQPPAARIIEYLQEQLKKPVSLDTHLELDLGIDSLTMVELIVGLEQRFGIKVPDETLFDVATVRDLIVKIRGLLQEEGRPEASVREAQRFDWRSVLDQLPEREIIDKIRLKTDLFDWLLLIGFKTAVWAILRLFWLRRISFRSRLPSGGPYLICANHASYLDGFFVFASLPLAVAIQTYFVGYARIFEHPLLRWALKRGRLIPIDATVDLVSSLRAVSFVLSQKKVVCIFPEGGRSIDDSIKEFKQGVGILMKELDVKAVGVYIRNSHRSWPRASRFPRPCPVEVVFGPALGVWQLLPDLPGKPQEAYAAIARGLRTKVEELR